MNYKKIIAVGLTSATLLSGAISTVSAAQMQLTRTSYVYNVKGKRVKSAKLAKGKNVRILGTKIIKGKKYYRIGKNKYVKVASLEEISNPATQEELDTLKSLIKSAQDIRLGNVGSMSRYELSSPKAQENFISAINRALYLVKRENSTSKEINDAKEKLDNAINQLDGQRYSLPCSRLDFENGRYTLTDNDKTAILNLVNKVHEATDAHFEKADCQYITYTSKDLSTRHVNTEEYLQFAKQ